MILEAARLSLVNLFAPETRSVFWKVLGLTILVLIGSNDLFAGRAVRDALPSAFTELVQALPDGAVAASLPQPRDAARRANKPLEEAAARGRLRMVDMRVAGPDSWRGKLAADWFHPNDAGYAALADAFEPVVLAATSPGS